MSKHLFIDCGAPSIYNEYSRARTVTSGAIMGSSFKDRKHDSADYIHSEFFKEYLEEYIKFCAALPKSDKLVISALDVINKPVETHEIWMRFRDAGIDAIPCWHLGSDVKWLEKYLHEYKVPYLAIGGMTPNPVSVLLKPLDDLWHQVLTDDKGMPYAKYHGFAMTGFRLMFRYPWYSVDSSAANVIARFGKVWIPDQYQDLFSPIPVRVSFHKDAIAKEKDGLWGFSPDSRKAFEKYLETTGSEIGETTLKTVKEGYKCIAEQEYWYDRGNKVVAVVVSPGVSNNFVCRWVHNMEYLRRVNLEIPEWPWAFKIKKGKLF